MRKINLILGTMNFGPQVDINGSKEMMNLFLENGYQELDSAYVYNDGVTEDILGKIFKDMSKNPFRIATKVNPRITGKLDESSIRMQLNESLKRMNLDSVDLLYLHFPDFKTPIEETLSVCNKLYEEGKIRYLGLSNFPAWLVVDAWHISDKKNWLKPSVYEGLYNGLSRKIENELFPAIRKLGIKFYAYNPLAGGMLTGRHLDFDKKPDEGRFARLESYIKRYWKKSYFEAVNNLGDVCLDNNIEPAEAAYRWLAFHSLLDGTKGDGIIIGASKLNQLEQNIIAVQKGELPQEIITMFDQAWDEAKYDSPEYFRTAQ